MTSEADTMVDWNVAVATATRLVRPGPDIGRDEARAVVAELRRHAAASVEPVRSFTRLTLPEPEVDGGPVLVVDRPGWVRANAAGFAAVLSPLTEKLRERRGAGPAAEALAGVGSKITGVEVGTLLAVLSSRVLGQFETFSPLGPSVPGRLLLVAPNIVQVERDLEVDPHDFRLWVCLHEETHRTQFTAVPWLRDHLEGEIRAFLAETEMDPGTMFGRLREAVQSGGGVQGRLRALRDRERPEPAEPDAGEEAPTLADLVQTPVQREILQRLTAVMSLLEGHADYVMDGVGPDVVPSVREIREKFTRRRERGAGRLDQVLRRVLGLDAKLRQYQEGERFVRTVVERVGMEGFNRVWTSPNTLPTRAEIHTPQAWVDRVHSGGAWGAKSRPESAPDAADRGPDPEGDQGREPGADH
ncbi:zinc-dependent metalloprotease [Allostreptomyces psammosilenae]|uniref:Coenzyme F420 biosynthesis associated uncharacterized protein n=1 Tax=Allostreptomyces psammosilenae TaxID=1892865 RepID=A0A852ZY76_9ACTN|nr:zinc-dependent metalloprotease [Allostreptomyces psammosilenae]NYI05674.1 coenzyme F420 biosynthesis associated uncharacterized protein [Allostreptomyces psammosilenae]